MNGRWPDGSKESAIMCRRREAQGLACLRSWKYVRAHGAAQSVHDNICMREPLKLEQHVVELILQILGRISH